MQCSAVIVENRFPVDDIIERHRKFLPEDWAIVHISQPITTIYEYNQLLVSRDFWEAMTNMVLIFQHDSGLLRKGIDEFLEYDYVGAPWAWQDFGGNGGLSLRSRDAMLKVIKNFQWHGEQEDVYFCKGLKELGLKLAPREVCEKFSVEACYKLGSLGWHGIYQWLNNEQINEILMQYD